MSALAAEVEADEAWRAYTAALQTSHRLHADPTSDADQRRGAVEHAIRAEQRFKRLFLAIDQQETI